MHISAILWTTWYAYWIVSARDRVRGSDTAPLKKEPLAGRMLYLALMVLGFALIFWRRVPFGQELLWPASRLSLVLGLAVQVTGLVFAVWARRTLGANWSARVAIGGQQQLIVRGPYRIVRHPIYSGLLFAILSTAVIVGEPRAFAGFLLILVSVLVKLRHEEAALREHFGEAYADYARRVPGLVPGWPAAGPTTEAG